MTAHDVEKLYEQGKKVQKLCVDIPKSKRLSDGRVLGFVEHHLPLLDQTQPFTAEENWDLSEKDKTLVVEALGRLLTYCKELDCGKLEEGVALLPPWAVFPHYPAGAEDWQTGYGKSYTKKWHDYLAGISQADFEAYQKKYPEPVYMFGNDDFSLNKINWGLRGCPCCCEEDADGEEKEDSAC